jgi:hypothetical protein
MSRPFIPVPNCASVELIYLANGQTLENIIHVHKGSPYSGADLITLRTAVNSWDAATWATQRSAFCTLQRIRTKALDSLGSPMEDFSLPTPRGGAVGAGTLPNNVTWCIKLNTGLTGRCFRGRLYFPGITLGHLNTGNFNEIAAASGTSIVNALNTLITNLATAGSTVGVVSYMVGGAWRSTGVFTAATGWSSIDLHLDSQRRRLTGRGA